MEDHTNLWRLLRRITEGESKKVVMSIKDEDGFSAWQGLKQRFEPGLAGRQGIVKAEFSGMVARLAKSTCDPSTHRLGPSKSCEALKKISCRSSPTTRRRAKKQCRLDELKQAPLRRRQQCQTYDDSWEEYGAINAMGSQQIWTCT